VRSEDLFKVRGLGAVVTGAASGIGLACARVLTANGANVALIDRDAARLGEAVGAVQAADGARVLGEVADVTDRATLERAFDVAAAAFGRIDVVFANAGISGGPGFLTADGRRPEETAIEAIAPERWGAILDTNLTSVYRTSKAVLRGMMKARKGRIISIASVIGLTGNPGQSNYAAAKAGIIAFSKSLAREIGSRGITVNVVAPGFIDTDMTKSLPEEQRNALLGQIALGRLGATEDIAQAVLFLASPAASYITGETLHVNGGMYMP